MGYQASATRAMVAATTVSSKAAQSGRGRSAGSSQVGQPGSQPYHVRNNATPATSAKASSAKVTSATAKLHPNDQAQAKLGAKKGGMASTDSC
ncbi:hypothetical protein HaLaN_10068 [Haematococcus lacustris]|uniref:Uncharacterized protein n=1 Tax=Haematococcus lacustris TaxID=44745 RepID=A0A699YY04_HAELA|nr:hypothetical protein HaLaN_10068 [Haematococcus lacustris]